jgi:hypothetical protein
MADMANLVVEQCWLGELVVVEGFRTVELRELHVPIASLYGELFNEEKRTGQVYTDNKSKDKAGQTGRLKKKGWICWRKQRFLG